MVGLLFNVGDEAEPALMEGADKCLIVSVIAERLARSVDPTRERRLRDDPSVPNGIKDLVLADNPLSIAEQEQEEVKDLRLNMHGRSRPTQFLAQNVQLAIFEKIQHQGNPSVSIHRRFRIAEAFSPSSGLLGAKHLKVELSLRRTSAEIVLRIAACQELHGQRPRHVRA